MPQFPPHTLRDGALVRVRHLRPSDEAAMRAAFRELSSRSRYQRFMAPLSELTDSMWHYLCDVDGRDHVALVAFPATELRIIGVTRFIRQSTDPATAELAVTIADRWQRRGLGSLMLARIADEARRRGIAAFVAHTLPGNVGVQRLMARHGRLHPMLSGSEHVLHLQLHADRPSRVAP